MLHEVNLRIDLDRNYINLYIHTDLTDALLDMFEFKKNCQIVPKDQMKTINIATFSFFEK